MITGATLADLRTALKQWSQRQNIPDEVLNDFINITTQRACRNLRIPPMEKSATILVDESGYLPIPADYLEVKELVSVRNGKNIILERKAIHEVDYMNNLSPGTPCFFGRFMENFRLAPYDSPAYDVPEDQDTVDLYYWAMLKPLVEDTDCNWLSSNVGELLLYGAMAELSSYTRDNEGEQRWNAKFGQEIATLQGVEDRSSWAGATLGISLNGSH